MEIHMADGKSVTLEELQAEVGKAKRLKRATTPIFNYVVVEALLEKLKALDPDKQFTLYWLGGDRQVVKGPDMATACNNAGIGGGALGALDFWDYGDSKTHAWDKTEKCWKPVTDTISAVPVKKPRTGRQTKESKNVS